MDVPEVYLQRLVYFPEGQGMARPDQALFAGSDDAEGAMIREAEALARSLGIAFNASGATDPAASLKPGETAQPWSLCRRPVDADVHHRAWKGAAVLHRAVFGAGL